jgi:hypothetical protein
MFLNQVAWSNKCTSATFDWLRCIRTVNIVYVDTWSIFTDFSKMINAFCFEINSVHEAGNVTSASPNIYES